MRNSMIFGVVGVLVGSVGLAVGSGSLASAAGVSSESDSPPSLVEDFTHPGADQILAEHGLKVYKGDGNIWFSSSRLYDSPEGRCPLGEIQVEKALDVLPYGVWFCFQTRGAEGYLTLEVPATFGIRGGGVPLKATADLGAEGEQAFEIQPNEHVGIDPGHQGEKPEAILVELRLTSGAS